MKELINYIKTKNLGELKENVSFSYLTSFKTGGTARLVFYPKNIDSLRSILLYLKDKNILYKVFGNGSNILASDYDYDGVIIKLTEFKDLKIDDTKVEAGSGFPFNVLCSKVAKLGLSGLEFGGGIPGTVGGAVYMNAGAYLEEVSAALEKIDILDEEYNFKTINKQDLKFDYRYSSLMDNNWIILKVYFNLKNGNKEEMFSLMEDRKERRASSQPLIYPSAGSVFRNPMGMYAGKLIEDSNLKGFTYGGAMISDKHANFIVNYNHAKSSDILYLINLAKEMVKQNFDIDLHREQELFNFGESDEKEKKEE